MDSHQNCVTFTGIVRANLNQLKSFTAQREYERGQTIYCQGDPADELYLIGEGQVKMVRLSPQGQQKILDIYKNGDIFGELCICGGHRRNEQAVALERLSVVSFQMEGLLKILGRQPTMVLELLQVFCARLGDAHEQIATLAFENIPRRLAKEILRFSRAPGAQVESGAVRLGIHLTHEELAQLVGTSREMITTVMNQFRQRGLVDYTRRNVVVYPERIEEFLNKTQS